jgi:indolepyruvate ferredoxin oxidoreductase
MSRYSGCWSAMKVVTDVVEGGGSVYVAPDSPVIASPPAPDSPARRRAACTPAHSTWRLPQEERLYHHKLYRVLAYARANALNRLGGALDDARIGVVAAGKAWQDLQQALAALGLDADRLRALGIRTLKVGLVWPLDPTIVRDFARGLSTVLVIEGEAPAAGGPAAHRAVRAAGRTAVRGKHADGPLFAEDRGARSSRMPARSRRR